MRSRFVKLNLKKSKFYKLKPGEQVFYDQLLFLEPHIHHRQCAVLNTLRGLDDRYKVYDDTNMSMLSLRKDTTQSQGTSVYNNECSASENESTEEKISVSTVKDSYDKKSMTLYLFIF